MKDLKAKTIALYIKRSQNAENAQSQVNQHFDEACVIAGLRGKVTPASVLEVIQRDF